MSVKVKDIMVTEVLTTKEASLLSAVLLKLAQYKKQLVVVVVDEHKKLKGLITPRRILQTISLSEFGRLRQPSIDWGDALSLLSSKTAGEVMGSALSVEPDQDIEEVVSIMLDKNIYALPVVDKKDTVIGRISIFDLIDQWVKDMEGEETT
ncbi:MAG TPA: CBS domain-containing protein [Dehalococcoidia bacterium]|nr:CBS domain-containing protein [Dehalococcoidia bacterium]